MELYFMFLIRPCRECLVHLFLKKIIVLFLHSFLLLIFGCFNEQFIAPFIRFYFLHCPTSVYHDYAYFECVWLMCRGLTRTNLRFVFTSWSVNKSSIVMGQRPVHSTPNVYQFSQPQYNIIEYSNAGSTVIQNRARNNDNISNISSFRQY